MHATADAGEKARLGDLLPRLELIASTVAELAKYENEPLFPLIADPERQLCRRFGVEHRSASVLSVRALRAEIAAFLGGRSTATDIQGHIYSKASTCPAR